MAAGRRRCARRAGRGPRLHRDHARPDASSDRATSPTLAARPRRVRRRCAGDRGSAVAGRAGGGGRDGRRRRRPRDAGSPTGHAAARRGRAGRTRAWGAPQWRLDRHARAPTGRGRRGDRRRHHRRLVRRAGASAVVGRGRAAEARGRNRSPPGRSTGRRRGAGCDRTALRSCGPGVAAVTPAPGAGAARHVLRAAAARRRSYPPRVQSYRGGAARRHGPPAFRRRAGSGGADGGGSLGHRGSFGRRRSGGRSLGCGPPSCSCLCVGPALGHRPLARCSLGSGRRVDLGPAFGRRLCCRRSRRAGPLGARPPCCRA